MPRGDKKAIMDYQVPDFPYQLQRKIGIFLNSIDEKIQYNRLINDNLAA